MTREKGKLLLLDVSCCVVARASKRHCVVERRYKLAPKLGILYTSSTEVRKLLKDQKIAKPNEFVEILTFRAGHHHFIFHTQHPPFYCTRTWSEPRQPLLLSPYPLALDDGASTQSTERRPYPMEPLLPQCIIPSIMQQHTRPYCRIPITSTSSSKTWFFHSHTTSRAGSHSSQCSRSRRRR